MARPKGETEEKKITMTQAEQDRIAERWLRITSAIKIRAERENGGKVASYCVIE